MRKTLHHSVVLILTLGLAIVFVRADGAQDKSEDKDINPAKKPPAKAINLAEVPELTLDKAFDRPINAEAARLLIKETAKNANQLNKDKIEGFVTDLRKKRPDLSGLPFIMGDDCRMAKDLHRPFATAGESVHAAITQMKSVSPAKQTGTLLMNAFSRAYLEVEEKDNPLPDPSGVGAQMTLPAFARLALHVRQGLAAKSAAPESAKCDVAGAQIAALMQILAPESAEFRIGLVRHLARVPHAQATRALARLAIFSEEIDVRQAACQALQTRYAKDYTDILVGGLNYPWPTVAQSASEAIVRLKRTELIPQLISALEQPEPGRPRIKEIDGKKVLQIRELVRINHHRNCLLCHAPGDTADIPADAIRADMPVPGEPLPSQSGYNRHSHGDLIVRIDVTYLRQDFSRLLPVADANPWPELQRFDFLVRMRTLTDQEAEAHREGSQPGNDSPYRRAALAALRGLSGRDTEPTAAAWRKLLGI